jgi:hypothetical protein
MLTLWPACRVPAVRPCSRGSPLPFSPSSLRSIGIQTAVAAAAQQQKQKSKRSACWAALAANIQVVAGLFSSDGGFSIAGFENLGLVVLSSIVAVNALMGRLVGTREVFR